jgi:hypothetical protein
MFANALGIVFFVYLIALRITKSRETSLYAVLLLFSVYMFVEKSVEIRPDVPQVLLGLISVYYLTKFFRTNHHKDIIISGITASISFLFLQKTIILLILYGLIFIYKFFFKKISCQDVFCFALSFVLPQILFIGYLLNLEILEEYIFTNWIMNINLPRKLFLLKLFKISLLRNSIFWILAVISSIFILSKEDNGLKIVSFLGLMLLLSIFVVNRPHRSYYLIAMAVLSIPAAYGLKMIFEKLKIIEYKRSIVLLLIVSIPFIFITDLIGTTNQAQLEKIDFVIQNSVPADFIYDGNIKFNLFRRDLHYFWYSVAPGGHIDTYNQLTNNRFGDYDICQLIKSRNPKIISDFEVRISDCGLEEVYHETELENLYIRK